MHIFQGIFLKQPRNDLFLTTQGDYDLARALLQAGVEPSASYLISAVRFNEEKLVAVLLEEGVGIDDWGQDHIGNIMLPQVTALHTAAGEGLLGMTLLLVQRGADKNIADEKGWTPLHEASLSGNVSVVQALMDAGADPTLRTEGHVSPFDVASSSEVMRLMLELGVDVNAAGASGSTALHKSLTKKVVDRLVEAGASI